MKIREVLCESGKTFADVRDWLKDYTVTYNTATGDYDYELGLEEDIAQASGYLARGIDELHLRANKDVVFKWPLQKRPHDSHFRLYLTTFGHELVIEKFSDLPKAHLFFTGGTIKSLDGIEDMGAMWVDFSGHMKFECGLLRLLKNKDLFIGVEDIKDRRLRTALSIIEKHKNNEGHDIAEAQEELIDADLDEYAKL